MTVRWFSVSRAARERRGLGSDEAEGFGSEGQRGEEREGTEEVREGGENLAFGFKNWKGWAAVGGGRGGRRRFSCGG